MLFWNSKSHIPHGFLSCDYDYTFCFFLTSTWYHFRTPPVMDPRLGDPTEEEEGCQQREAMPMPGGWEKPDFFMGQVG